MDAPAPRTLEAALRSHAVDLPEVVRRYPGPAALVRRILGVYPRAMSLLEIWPPGLVTYNLAVPAFFDVPKCDIGFGITPELRARVAHAASRAFGCHYCAAHTAIMGTLMRGPVNAANVSARVGAVESREELAEGERNAVEYAVAMATIPNRLSADLRRRLDAAYTADEVEAIVLTVTVMGFLNRCMHTLGVPLETAVHDAVRSPLRAAGWDPGEQDDSSSAHESARLARPSRLGLLREVPGALAFESAALADVPKDLRAQCERVEALIHFVPEYLHRLRRASARRVLVHMLLERLHVQGLEVDASVKALMGWVHARAGKSHVLAAHFAFVAHRSGVSIDDIVAASATAKEPADTPDAAALAFAHATSTTASELPESTLATLVDHHGPASIVELVTVLACISAIQRYVATLTPHAYERPIAEFVAEHGDALGLPGTP